MKKLLGAMAAIALLTSPVAMAQPDHENGNQQGRPHEARGGEDRHGPQRQTREREDGQRQDGNRRMGQREAYQRHANQRQTNQRQAFERQAANRTYNASTYRTADYGYADPARYRNNGLHRGWAQDRGNAYRWSEGERMGYNDWYYAPRVSYRRHNLRRPPYGYQWRRYDDRYVLVAISTGLIMSVIMDAGR